VISRLFLIGIYITLGLPHLEDRVQYKVCLLIVDNYINAKLCACARTAKGVTMIYR
jgi:hypothetical protein